MEEIIASLEQQGITVRRNEQVERALFLSGYEALDEIEEFENGLLYVQDTASMLAVELAAPKPVSYTHLMNCMRFCGKWRMAAANMW